MLTVNAHTRNIPLTVANLLTTTRGSEHDITVESGDGFMSGVSDGVPFLFPKIPGTLYGNGEFVTDAIAVTWQDDSVFAAMCTELSRSGNLVFKAERQITCELMDGQVKYYVSEPCEVFIGVDEKPSTVTVNGKQAKIVYDAALHAVKVRLSQGEGNIIYY